MDSTDNQGSPKEWNLDLPQVDGERAVGASDFSEVCECERRSRETSSRNRKRALRVCESLRGTVCQHLRENSILAYHYHNKIAAFLTSHIDTRKNRFDLEDLT